MKIKPASFQFKITISYLLIIILSFGFVAFYLDKSLEEIALRDIKSSLVKQAKLSFYQIPPEKIYHNDITYIDALADRIGRDISCRVTIIKADGTVIADSEKSPEETLKMDNHAVRPEIKSALDYKIGEYIRYSATLKIDMFYVAVPLLDKNDIVAVVRLALPLTSVREVLFEIKRTIIISLFFALALAFVIGSLIARGLIKPINKIIRISRKYSAGDFSYRVHHDSRDEIGELTVTLNKMAGDIEEKIKEIEIQGQHMKAVFQSMVEGIIVVDSTGRIVSLNPAAENIFKIKKPEAQNRYFLEVIRNNDMSEMINAVLKGKEFISREISLVWPVHAVFQTNISPIFEKGSISGCFVVIHDITRIRKLEAMRKDFVANVSHELKTPLTSVKGFVETLLEGALEDKENSRNFLKIIHDHVDRLDALINDLLDLSYLESKEIKLDTEVFDMRGLIDEVLSGFSSRFEKNGLKVTNEISADIKIKADKGKIGQVITNLVDNAIKFNHDNGSIVFYAKEQDGEFKFIVEDSGQGIPEKDVPRIFERFYRVDKARSRDLGGTGLGLSIVKHIIELHGGRVGVESTEGFGSCFWFTLPK